MVAWVSYGIHHSNDSHHGKTCMVVSPAYRGLAVSTFLALLIWLLKIERCHYANFVVTLGTETCHNDNLRCHQQRQLASLQRPVVMMPSVVAGDIGGCVSPWDSTDPTVLFQYPVVLYPRHLMDPLFICPQLTAAAAALSRHHLYRSGLRHICISAELRPLCRQVCFHYCGPRFSVVYQPFPEVHSAAYLSRHFCPQHLMKIDCANARCPVAFGFLSGRYSSSSIGHAVRFSVAALTNLHHRKGCFCCPELD